MKTLFKIVKLFSQLSNIESFILKIENSKKVNLVSSPITGTWAAYNFVIFWRSKINENQRTKLELLLSRNFGTVKDFLMSPLTSRPIFYRVKAFSSRKIERFGNIFESIRALIDTEGVKLREVGF